MSTTTATTATQPAISVIVPIYNVEQYLEQTLKSVLNQSFEDWELILVDDGSSDNSLAIARNFAQSDPRIRVIALPENTPGGAGIPSNIGLSHACGKYVAFLDSDDLYLPTFLEQLYKHSEVFEEVDIAMIRYQIYYLDRNKTQTCYPDAWSWLHLISKKLGSKQQRRQVRYVQLDQTQSCIRHRESQQAWSKIQAFYLLYGLSVVPWRKLYRRSFLQQHHIQFPEGEHFFEDVPLHWMACTQANNVLFCDELLYQHSMNRLGQTINSNVEKQIYAKLFQAEQTLHYLLPALEQGQLGKGAEFYLLLWLRSLIHTFSYGLQLPQVQQWQIFYLETETMLRRQIQAHPQLAQILQPLHKLRLSDAYHLKLDLLEAIAWQLLTSRILKERKITEGCDKLTMIYLIVLKFPLTNYWRALRERLRYLVSKLCMR